MSLEAGAKSLDHLTFRGNRGRSRHDWLRLTPAYSVQLVERLLDETKLTAGPLLDPFCGSGTTALVCAERGIPADTTDINPFLLWLARAKCRAYSERERRSFVRASLDVARALAGSGESEWVPPLHRIERWWSPWTLSALSRGFAQILRLARSESETVADLLKVAFCRAMIARANVSFGHQSMSFRQHDAAQEDEGAALAGAWAEAVQVVEAGAALPLLALPRAVSCDARELSSALMADSYHAVITSPPYPNRMSYVRELRPYMYWLGFLDSGKSAGQLDWQAIGGTWGAATSNLTKWAAPAEPVCFEGFVDTILPAIKSSSPLLASYVNKYFCDMQRHVQSLRPLLKPRATVHYIVGNSKFFDVVLPVERIFQSIFASSGFSQTSVNAIRKRSSKKELYEFVVSARKS
jgi:hypothetical protein